MYLEAYDVVLIETLWNVKSCQGSGSDCQLPVLIETLWNVKITFAKSLRDMLLY